MEITATHLGPVIMLAPQIGYTELAGGQRANIGLAIRLDDTPIYLMVWEAGGDWDIFSADDYDAAHTISTDDLRDAIDAAVKMIPSAAEDLEWFSDWALEADEAEADAGAEADADADEYELVPR